MQLRALIMLAVALIMGGLAVYLVNSLLSREQVDEAKVQPAGEPVVVAVKDLEVGTRLDEVMLKAVDWPSTSVPEGHYTDVKKVIGEKPPIVLREIRKGEPVLQYKLSPYGARGGLTPKIPVEKRAITISVNEVKGVAGFVLPGDRVDIMMTSNEERKDKKPVTRTVLQNVEVLGVDQISSEKEDKPVIVNAVTLLVTPEEGKKLTLAQTIGALNLMLRNEADVETFQDQAISLSALQNIAATTPKRSSGTVKRTYRPSGSTVRIIRGLSIDTQRVKDPSKPAASGEAVKKAQ